MSTLNQTTDVDLKFIKLDNIRKMIKQSNKPFTAKCEWKGDKLYINGDLYFDEAEYLSQIDGRVYNFENSSWIYSSTLILIILLSIPLTLLREY